MGVINYKYKRTSFRISIENLLVLSTQKIYTTTFYPVMKINEVKNFSIYKIFLLLCCIVNQKLKIVS